MEANGDRWGGWSVGERLDCSQYLILISESERETESQSVLEDVKRGADQIGCFFFLNLVQMKLLLLTGEQF